MMHITASFIKPPRLLPLVLVATWLTALALMISAGWLVSDWWTLRAEIPSLSAELPALERRRAAAQEESRNSPSEAQLSALSADVAALNGTSLVRGWSTAQLLTWFAAHMPADVNLVSLHHKSSEGEALLVAEAANASVLTHFLSLLEREKNFSEVMLSKQATHSDRAEEVVQFEIKLRLKP
jgi:hypothetical protein